MLPPSYVDELRSAWVEDVDFIGTFEEMFEGKHTTFGDRSQHHPTVTRGPITQNIRKLRLPLRIPWLLGRSCELGLCS